MCDKVRTGQSREEEIYKTLSQVEAKTAIKQTKKQAKKYITGEKKKKTLHTRLKLLR